MMNLFYTPDIFGDIVELDEQESKHTLRVLRLKAGDPVQLVDGKGGLFRGEIIGEQAKRCRIRIISHTYGYRPLPYHLHLAVSPTKSADRFEWFLEKATEIGISEITPLLCQRSERSRINLERSERILVSAMKQSLRAFKPYLHAPQQFDTFISTPVEGTLGIAHCISESDRGLKARSGIRDLPRSERFTLLVGPEGDFSEEEVGIALAAGYLPFHLGEARLRTETAGIYICAAMGLFFSI
jgi:16S rRNA (uracil1498-N3)-methyltransferase